ncbi:MAG: DUF2817 domain-containing protein [Candidatus Delongbacteria bacterium]|nr:DUF2817 domain-containing protein [Candidatus Delongbacteria bacterium]
MRKIIYLILITTVLVFSAKKFEYAKVKVSGPDDLKFMKVNKVDVDRTSFQGNEKGFPEYLKVYVDQERFELIEKEGYTITWEPLKLPKDATAYRYNEDIGDSMLVWQNRYPTICKRIPIGTSVQGRTLWVLKISDNVDIEEAEIEMKFVSTMHGDEVTGVEMEMYMIEDILYGYQANNDTMQFIVNNTELYVMPLMNPDGMALNQRYNANNVDLNRDFPEGLYSEPNVAEADEPEIDALINWSNDHNFVLSTNYHGGALVTNYGYDIDTGIANYAYAPAPDDLHLTWLAYNYSVRNPPMFNSSEFTDGITNGSEWYQITGGMQDWNYRYYNDIDMTLEISSTKWPAFSEIAGFWQDNRDAMFWYLSAAHKGIYGIVTDYDTGLPLDATIEIAGIDKEYYTDPDFGDYYRILKSGTYNMTVSAPGYLPQTINNIVVTDDTGSFKEATEVNVQLVQMLIGGTFILDHSALSYGNVGVGSNIVKTFEITNSHATEYIMGNITTISGYSVDTSSKGEAKNVLDYTVSPSSSKIFNLTFAPTSEGSFNGNITITSTDSAHPTEYIAVTGAGTAPSFEIPFSQDFNASISLPTAWEIVDIEGNGQVWQFGTHTSGLSGADGNYAYVNSDAYGSGNSQNTDLLTPKIDMSNAADITLEFSHYFNWYSSSDIATLSYSVDGGSNWIQIQQWSEDTTNPASFNQAIPALDGEANVKIKWNFTGSWGYYWDIDDVLITGTITSLGSPLNVIPDAISSSCSLSWDAVSGATTYNVYRSIDPYSGFTFIGSSGTNSYTDSEALSGNKYFYQITADNTK